VEALYQLKIIRFLKILLLLAYSTVLASDPKLRGQASLYGVEQKLQNQWQSTVGVYYFPEVTYEYSFNGKEIIDAELSLNGFFNSDFKDSNARLKLYRFKVRYVTPQTEIRLGLQQLNFGPARLLRPLMWFDRIDPRDPIKVTDGVYGLRAKHTFLDNSEISLWGLYGNTQPKGFERFGTVSNEPEGGGRVQIQIPMGEVSATAHTRYVDASTFRYRENRFSIDGRWDIEIGFWFESVFQQSRTKLLPFEWNTMVTLGADYTFGIENGIYFLTEQMVSMSSNRFLGNNQDSRFSAAMASYPVSVFDNVMAIGYYGWDEKKYYQYYQWQRTYDDFILCLGLFYYPASGKGAFRSTGYTRNEGYGLQLMVIYNH
jgi:hypothetical protein